jgi:hypothetical protein
MNDDKEVKVKTHSEETRKKMSDSHTGKPLSEETKRKIRESKKGEKNPMYGKEFSEEHRKRLSDSKKGKTFTEEHKKKLSDGKKGDKNPNFNKHHSEEHKRNLSYKSRGEKSGTWKGGVSKNNIPLYDTYGYQLEKYEETRENDYGFLEVRCTYCGKWFQPTIKQVNNRLVGINSNGGANLYCSTECKKECPIYRQKKYYRGKANLRSREVQPELRQLVFLRDGYECQKCGATESLHCHHIDPVILNPIESADVDNCITLCKECHKWCHKQNGCTYHDLRRGEC